MKSERMYSKTCPYFDCYIECGLVRKTRKQTLMEVLKEIKKYKLFWKGQKDTFNFSKEMRFNLMHQLDLIEKYLKQKIKELKEAGG